MLQAGVRVGSGVMEGVMVGSKVGEGGKVMRIVGVAVGVRV